jgi:putative Mg2+ transporter-C (MgtC) family protein
MEFGLDRFPNIQRITTAATIWVVGAIGVACGVGQYLVALTLASYAGIILRVIGSLQHRTRVKDGASEKDDDTRDR